MDASKLHIFSKNTDAFASQRGYNYQTLKTLETWVNNLAINNEENIYCEYEEDIFQKNELGQRAKFRQIKLYSSNFSFKSEEVTKCISHFFMLHVKTEYTSFDKEFIFETNSEVARTHLNNEADLLKEWSRDQENLSEEQIKKIAEKTKEIVSRYIQNQEKSITNDNNADLVKEAVAVFNKIDDSFWIEFVKLIKWQFLGTDSDVEFSNAKSRIEEALNKLPYDIDNVKQVFAVLLERVFTKTSQENPEDRKVTTRELELLILNVKNEEDKWYSQKFELYDSIDKIEQFRIGEFFEILDLANYCRRKRYLNNHKKKWIALLAFYANDNSVNDFYKRKAVYELVFLNSGMYEVDYNNLQNREKPNGNLFGLENEIKFYFNDFSGFRDIEELEKAQTVLNLLLPVVLEKRVHIDLAQYRIWIVKLYKTIHQRLLRSEDKNEKCYLLEEKGSFLLIANAVRNRNKLEFTNYFEQILEIIEEAPLYKASQLGERINKLIKNFIHLDSTDQSGIINALESFSEKLYPYIEKREGKVKLAKQQIEKGISYLYTTNRSGLLKALEYFHKAKDNYLQEDTIEGFILGLLNIAQLYNSIGMHFAAKYYALAAFRMSINKEFVKHVEKSFALMFYSDYKQGSWFNAIDIYDRYISLRDQSNLEQSDYDEEGMITQRLSFILYTLKKLSFQYNFFIDGYINYLGYIGEEIVKPVFDRLDQEFDTVDKIHKALRKEIDDFPINDIGNERIISFYALGSLWKIKFENTHSMMAVAEEYISSLQIVLAEISLSGIDFHFIKGNINLELKISDSYQPPIEEPSNNSAEWKVSVCYFDSPNPTEINKHALINTMSVHFILNGISLLEEKEFQDLFVKFIGEQSLDKKQTSVNLYQRIHRDIYIKEDFDFSQRQHFQKENFLIDFPTENKFMEWNNSLSARYDRGFSIDAIKNRFNNATKCIHMTLEHLKKNKDFPKFINDLRKQGWKDWQIVSNIFNFILNYKINRFEKIESTDENNVAAHFDAMFRKYKALDEKDCYVQFPLDAFKTKEFSSQFEISFGAIIQTYGLKFKSSTPNFVAIKEFLDIRFNFVNDDYVENNPLKDIPYE